MSRSDRPPKAKGGVNFASDQNVPQGLDGFIVSSLINLVFWHASCESSAPS